MRLPRRVPWSSPAELDQLCTWIFADQPDVSSKWLAVNRLSAWRATTYLPHALESTLSILTAILQDAENENGRSWLSVRQSYATAIIRLVNGLVDPLQQGSYARSIASIAAQLELPAWFVELRHAATHEDMPSLELLREAAKESLNWLLHHYFLPAINPSADSMHQPPPLRSLSAPFKQYKNLLKQTLRDSSLISRHSADIGLVMREVERWVSEAVLASNIKLRGLEWEDADDSETDEEDTQEIWALEKLCGVLLEEGGLVPLSKKKRLLSEHDFLPPEFSVSLWSPLMAELQSNHPAFPRVLIGCIVKELLQVNSDETSRSSTSDPQYLACLSRWAFWSAQKNWPLSSTASETDLRQDALVSLITALGPTASPQSAGEKAAYALLQELTNLNPELRRTVDSLVIPNGSNGSQAWAPSDMDVMDQRLESLASMNKSNLVVEEAFAAPSPDAGVQLGGWRLLTTQDWRRCPIGVYQQ